MSEDIADTEILLIALRVGGDPGDDDIAVVDDEADADRKAREKMLTDGTHFILCHHIL